MEKYVLKSNVHTRLLSCHIRTFIWGCCCQKQVCRGLLRTMDALTSLHFCCKKIKIKITNSVAFFFCTGQIQLIFELLWTYYEIMSYFQQQISVHFFWVGGNMSSLPCFSPEIVYHYALCSVGGGGLCCRQRREREQKEHQAPKATQKDRWDR